MASKHKEYDAIIIGARVAGSITGSLLADQGLSVLALDRATFPSDTLSTHFFRAPSFRSFDAIGVMDEVGKVAPKLTVNYNVIDGIVFPEPVDRPDDYPFFMCIRRITLDNILVQRLKRTPNVEMIEGAKARELLRDEDGKVIGVQWKDKDGLHEARARVVIGADGVRSFVAKEVDAVEEREEEITRAMYFAYYKNVPHNEGPAAEFHYRGNHIGYVMPTDQELTLLAISVPIDKFSKFKRDPEGQLMAELGKMTEIAPRLSKAERDSKVLGTGSIPCYMRVPYGPGWALVGDASLALDPWSGQGIDQGSTHAVMMGKHMGEFLSGTKDWETAMGAHHKERNEFSEKAYRRTAKFGHDLRPMTEMALAKRGLK
jgi:flavin-dependent dehydrogenase